MPDITSVESIFGRCTYRLFDTLNELSYAAFAAFDRITPLGFFTSYISGNNILLLLDLLLTIRLIVDLLRVIRDQGSAVALSRFGRLH